MPPCDGRLRLPSLAPARAIVFDKDGVLVDFAPRWLAITAARLDAIAARMALAAKARTELQRLLGVHDSTIDPTGPLVTGSRAEQIIMAAGFLYQHGKDFLEARELVESAFDDADFNAKDAPVRPTGELKPALSLLHAQGIKLGIATTDLTARAQEDLNKLGIAAYFDAVLGVDAVKRNKPHPDLFLGACHALGVAPGEAWMVGDALNDMRMARAANAAGAIGVRSGISTGSALEAEADMVLDGIWEIGKRAIWD